MNYYRGSEWRRWDLHLHTPETKKNDQFVGASVNEKWDAFYAAIAAYIGNAERKDHDIAVIGITDYLSIDNYLRVCTDNRLPPSVKLVIPNVEMRIIPMAAHDPVNIHLLFDPEYVCNLEDKFFSQLTLQAYGTKYTATRQSLISLGRRAAGTATSEKEAYVAGIDQFVVSLDVLRALFEADSELRSHTLIGVANKSNDGASGITAHKGYDNATNIPQLATQRQALYQFADFIFSGNAKDRSYFLGQGADSEQEVIQKCHSVMPCIHGSDAHSLDKLFEPDQQRYCWIKADPTFDGLRQILYEPADRVIISAVKPAEKADYHVIESVSFESEEFSPEPVVFNDQLTCIIGGKSTGKSLLLHNMAYAVDAAQVNRRGKTSTVRTKTVPSLCVHWRDGTTSSAASSETPHSLVYLPQSYLNRLSEGEEETSDIDVIIEEIVLQNDEVKQKYEQMQASIEQIKQISQSQIIDAIKAYEELSRAQKQISEIGNKEGIEKELAKLTNEKEQLASSASLSSEDIERYSQALRNIAEAEQHNRDLEHDLIVVRSITSVVERRKNLPSLSSKSEPGFAVAVHQILEVADEKWHEIQAELINKIEEAIAKTTTFISEQKKIRDILQPRVAENEALQRLTDAITSETKKMNRIKELIKQQENHEYIFNELVGTLAEAFIGYQTVHCEFVRFLNSHPELSIDDLTFQSKAPFRCRAFCDQLSSLFDNRRRQSYHQYIDLDKFDIEAFTLDKVALFIKACISGELVFAKGNTSESVLRVFLSDWCNTTYDVTMDGDPISQMSPGKKALVLLKLLISLQDSKCPILIDQPEDDLDNRSVFSNLIPFIRKKKVERQIIVVTHNANVVVGGDAECVIVANQSGTNSPNGNWRFEYRSGAIENTQKTCPSVNGTTAGILYSRSIQEHICDILEGGKQAFDLRKRKYHI